MRWYVLFAVAAAFLLTACGGGEDVGDDAFVHIGMMDNFFTREVTRVPVGGTVRFQNDGATIHNAFANDGSWSTPDVMEPGDSVDLTFDEPGVYHYYCTFHATPPDDPDELGTGMVATLVVGDVEYQAGGAAADIEPVTEWTGETRRVPQDYPTIQNAVDAADPGDLVLVDRGVYREQVNVTTPYLTIRGVDRQEVIIDGEFTRPNAINVAAADGVAVENLTTRNATLNGVFFTGLTGYRTSYVTAHNNGVYGIYSFDATDGVFEHSYASGSPDAGFYIGQCDPCRAVIADSVAEWNALGYSGTNASGQLYLIRSEWRDNVAGLVPNTLDTELKPPFHDVTIAGNVIHDNGNTEAPTLPTEWGAYGAGVGLAGGLDSVVEHNLFVNNATAGVMVMPNVSKNFWMPGGNTIRNNVIRDSGVADMVLVGPSQGGDCFEGNDFTRSNPPGLETFHGCDGGLRLPYGANLSATATLLGRVAEGETGALPDNPWQEAPAPTADDQPDMPGGADAPVRPATNAFAEYHPDIEDDPAAFLASIETPSLSDDDLITTSNISTWSINVFGVNLVGSFWTVFFGLYAYLLPFVLYAAWVAIALWDLARREDLERGPKLGWIAVIFLVPFLGVIAYHAAGRSELPGWLRGAIVGGGLVAYLVILGIGATLGGLV